MTNTVLLEQKIKDSGLKKGFLADKIGISLAWLGKKIVNEVPFKANEIQVLCHWLSITDLQEKNDIFFAEDVEESSTN